jgi:hypothetical protein
MNAVRDMIVERQREYQRARIIDKAIKLIGKDERGLYRADKGSIDGELYSMQEVRAALEPIRARDSKQSKRALEQFGKAVLKAKGEKGGLHKDFRLLFGLDEMWQTIDAHVRKPRTPRRAALEKSLAARAALNLCEKFHIKPTKAKGGILCKLAALLYGDESADLKHHCFKAVNERRHT